MDEGIGLAMALTLPAAAALFIAPAFLIEGIFTRGAFTADDAAAAANALIHYAWGVPAFVLIKVLAPAFFAREDTKTPMRYALVSVAINTGLGAGLFFYLRSVGAPGFPGLAIATSVAAWANVLLFVLALSVTVLALLVQPEPIAFDLQGIPPQYFLGGVFVAFYVLSATFIAPKIGLGNAIVLVLLGQLLASSAIDHFGWLGTQQTTLSPGRGIGLLLIFCGVVLARRPMMDG